MPLTSHQPLPPPPPRPSMAAASIHAHSSPELYPHAQSNDMAVQNMVASTLQSLEQRTPPTLHEILAAFTSKGDGDRDMLFALLNAKAAEDNRIAAERNLRRSLLEMYKGPRAASPATYMPEGQGYAIPSPPASSYRDSPRLAAHSPYHGRRASRSPAASSQSSDEASYMDSRKRRRSHSPGSEHPPRRQGSLSAVTRSSDAPLPPSPYSSASSGSGSPRSRETMNIGSLLTASHERVVQSSQQVSYVRREDDSGRRQS